MTGDGAQLRRVPPCYDHWLLHYQGRYEHHYDSTRLNPAHLWPVEQSSDESRRENVHSPDPTKLNYER